MPFSKLGLSDQLVQGILATGYTAPTAIQTHAIPLAVAGRDVIGCARTGTGKTAAFVLPLLHHLTKNSGHHSTRHIRALVLTPTRELAQQAEDFITSYGRFTSVQSLAVFGGVSMDNQVKRLRRGVDIVAATPGRLIDHLNRRTADLSRVEVLVLDEADRMFDMGFINDVRTIIAHLPAKRQTLLFSATMSKEVRALVASIQKNPELIEIGEQRHPVETVRQHFYSVEQETKLGLLLHVLKTQPMESVLVFSRTKHGADKISRRLERNGVKSIAIHANRTQAQRQHALAGFKRGHYTVLVATDIAARGIDVEGISHVINYDTPAFAEDYIHRIGRTGRATATGDAITFVSHQERDHLKKIEHFVGRKYELKQYPGFDHAQSDLAAPASGGGHGKREERSVLHHRTGSRTSRVVPQHRNRRWDRKNRPSPGTGSQRDAKKQRPGSASTASEGNDWRKLIASVDEERSGIGKKLKRFFKRA